MSNATTANESTERCNPAKIAVGSVFSRHSFGKVVAVDPYRIRLKNEKGFEWEIGHEIVRQELSFADQFEVTKPVSRTEAINALTEHSHTAMTVVFRKKPDAKAVAELLKGGQGKDSDKQWKAKVTDAIDGEQRTMIGYHSNVFDEHRRLWFTEIGVGPRLVDPRTIESIIVDRVRYEVKS